MVRIGKNDMNNRRLIEYAIAYCNSRVALLLIGVLIILTVFFFCYKYNPMFSTMKPECILAIICQEYSVGIVLESENSYITLVIFF